jgi:uncharacterized membrane-anchored protein
MNDDELRRQIQRDARSAYRWANISMWASGCALALWAIPFVVAVIVAIWVYLALR